jgi:hypothetical protein
VVDPWDAWNEVSLSGPVGLDRPRLELFATGWLRTEVNNGGFNQLFFNSAGDLVPVAVEALRREGAAPLADLVVRAMAVLGDRYPSDRTARQDTLEAGGDDVDQRLEALDEEYYGLEASVDLDDVMQRVVDSA